jgi:hypothetical protein
MGNIKAKCLCNGQEQFFDKFNLNTDFSDNINIPKTKKRIKSISSKNELSKSRIFSTVTPNINIRSTDKLINLQSIVRGFIYRKHFELDKETLKNQEVEIINKIKNKIQVDPNVTSAEKNCSNFNINGWKKFYSQQYEHLFCFPNEYFGLILNAKIICYGDMSYYIGTVNVKNQKCGYGTFINPQGCKYEGNWLFDKFTGWGLHIDKEGTIWEGNF